MKCRRPAQIWHPRSDARTHECCTAVTHYRRCRMTWPPARHSTSSILNPEASSDPYATTRRGRRRGRGRRREGEAETRTHHAPQSGTRTPRWPPPPPEPPESDAAPPRHPVPPALFLTSPPQEIVNLLGQVFDRLPVGSIWAVRFVKLRGIRRRELFEGTEFDLENGVVSGCVRIGSGGAEEEPGACSGEPFCRSCATVLPLHPPPAVRRSCAPRRAALAPHRQLP